MIVREMVASDREAAREALTACGVFSAEEIGVALDLLDEGLAGELDDSYSFLAAELEGKVRGYVCIGRTPLTVSTWHLYWIVVHPSAQRGGVGRALQTRTEDFIRARGGERLVLETSGRADYERARQFYLSAGYEEAGRIRDYYKQGDDCVLFCKRLT